MALADRSPDQSDHELNQPGGKEKERTDQACSNIMDQIFASDPEGSFGGGAGKLPHRCATGSGFGGDVRRKDTNRARDIAGRNVCDVMPFFHWQAKFVGEVHIKNRRMFKQIKLRFVSSLSSRVKTCTIGPEDKQESPSSRMFADGLAVPHLAGTLATLIRRSFFFWHSLSLSM